ncbi:MAG TPA: dihydrolipoamide acyltransferase [Phycisphaerales bacterium]|nr:dihydrolipoamide acyltransferase [Phycisphaerales bacterium]
MPIEITMPRLSDTMERGTIVHWNVNEGDKVSPGAVLGDIETDKATMELQSFDSGVVAVVLLAEGQAADVGARILVLAEKGEDPAAVKARFAGAAPGSKSAPRAEQAKGSGAGVAAPSATAVMDPPAHSGANGRSGAGAAGGGEGRVFVSPLARKIAEEKGIDLAGVTGTGPAGRIVRRDVERAPALAEPKRTARGAGIPAPSVDFGAGTLEKKRAALSNMRATIAKRLVQSKTTIPHYQVTLAVDMDPLLTLRAQLNDQLASQGVKLSVNDFIVRACALAMHQHPFINASWGSDGQSIDLHDRVNVGIAISLPPERGGGLVVGVLRDADRAGLRQISAQSKALASKAREKGLTIDEMDGASFTISNLGMFGVEHFTAIINPPNSAILAVGAAVEKPVVRGGQIVVGHEMQMTMSSDHRVIDGAMAAAYLGTVKGSLEAPATLLV